MKLLFVTDNGFSFKDNNYYYSNANIEHYKLATKFFDDIVFIARNNKYDNSSNQINNKFKTYLVDSVTENKNPIKNYLNLSKIIESEIIDTDLVICFGLNGNIAYRIAKKNKTPTLVFVGADHYEILKNMNSLKKKVVAPIYKKINERIILNSNYVHYVSEDLFKKYPNENKYLICSDASIRVHKKNIKTRINKIENHSLKDSIVIGLIGYTHNRIKGIDTAIKALSLLDEKYKLEIVGRGNNEWLKKLSSEIGVEDRVTFHGVLKSRDEVFDWLDGVDIYIQPSLTEGMPRATLEAMSRGCPVISTNVGGLKSIVDKEDRIKAGNFKQLAYRIENITQSKTVLINKTIKSYNTVKNFRPELLNQKKHAFYEEILNDLK